MSFPPTGESPQNPGQRQVRNISPEELRVLTECSRDAFWRRCIPLTVVFCAGVAYSSRRSLVKPKGPWGLVPKYATAIFSGYIIGKMSYFKECRSRIMQLRNHGNDVDLDSQSGTVLAEIGAERSSRYKPDAFGSHLERDLHSGDRPPERGGDAYYEGGPSFPQASQNVDSGSRRSASYEDLRRENRAEYDRSQRRNAQRGAEPSSRTSDNPVDNYGNRSGASFSSGAPAEKPVKRNKYGDAFE